jgi:hypothetical protein
MPIVVDVDIGSLSKSLQHAACTIGLHRRRGKPVFGGNEEIRLGGPFLLDLILTQA